MSIGRVKSWNFDTNFGVITADGGREYSVHLRDIAAAPLAPTETLALPEGAAVVFAPPTSDQGLVATRVRVIEAGVSALWAYSEDGGQLVRRQLPGDPDELNTPLRAVAQGDPATFRRVQFSASTGLSAEDIVNAAPRSDGIAILRDIAFDEATFDDAAPFSHVRFEGESSWSGTRFRANASFNGAEFVGNARFDNVTFEGPVTFGGATFRGACWFTGATFENEATFNGIAVGAATVFDGATFRGPTLFMRGDFAGAASFENEATFEREVRFDETKWRGGVSWPDTRFRGETRFAGATFFKTCVFSGTLVGRDFATATFSCDDLVFDEVTFTDRVTIAGAAAWLSCRRTLFLGGAYIRLEGVTADLTEAEFTRASTLSGRDIKVLSMKDAYVRDLTLTGADLVRCRFIGAQSLDQMRVGDSTFASSPSGWHWSHRSVLFDECVWRSWGGQAGEATAFEARLGIDPPPEPRQIAIVYRELRKGREDSKDEPGAADFYYGEMEMRRHAGRPPSQGVTGRLSLLAERGVLWAYWLVCGYALRAVRALIALLITIVACGALLYWVGFVPQPTFARALLMSAETSSSLLRPIQSSKYMLTPTGETIDIALRLLGPLFLGLFLLSLRGRVKR